MPLPRILMAFVLATLCASSFAACATTRTREDACRGGGLILWCESPTHFECYDDNEFQCRVCQCVN